MATAGTASDVPVAKVPNHEESELTGPRSEQRTHPAFFGAQWLPDWVLFPLYILFAGFVVALLNSLSTDVSRVGTRLIVFVGVNLAICAVVALLMRRKAKSLNYPVGFRESRAWRASGSVIPNLRAASDLPVDSGLSVDELLLSVLDRIEPLMQAAFDAVGGTPLPGSTLDQAYLIDGREIVVGHGS